MSIGLRQSTLFEESRTFRKTAGQWAAAAAVIAMAVFALASCNLLQTSLFPDTVTQPPHSVAYNANGATTGSPPADTQEYLPGMKVHVKGNTGNLHFPGCTFAGWNTRADGTGTSYLQGDTFYMGAAGVTLFALWTTQPVYTVTYSGNGSSGGAAPTDGNNYIQGATVTVLGNTGSLVKTGYGFTGWNTAANGSGTALAPGQTLVMGTTNVTLYAQWAPAYSVTYTGNGSTSGSPPVDPGTYVQNATVTVLGNTGTLARTGYSFTGWNTLAGGGGSSYSQGSTFPMGNGPVTLYAQWTNLPTYTVTYNGNGSTGGSVPTDSTNYLPGATATVQSNTGGLSRTGYVLVGWNTQAGGGGTEYVASDTFTMGSVNVTLYAQWTPTYTVTYNANGATSGSAPVDGGAYRNGVVVTVLGNTGLLARTGYNFIGWNTQAGGGGTSYSGGATFTMGSADVTLYAQWSAAPTYHVTYNANGGTGTPPSDGTGYLPNDSVSVLGSGSLVNTGYVFAAWNTQANGSGTTYLPLASFTMASADVTLYAMWQVSEPALNPASGHVGRTGTVTLTCATPGASMLYTLDGSVPTETGGLPTHGTLYSGPFTLPYGATTVSVLAYKSGAIDSVIASGTLTVPIYLYAAGSGGITVQTVNVPTGALSAYAVAAPSSSGVVTDPTGKYLFTPGTGVSSYVVVPSTGSLMLVTGEIPAPYPPQGLVIDSTGAFLYGLDGNDEFEGFQIDTVTGLAPILPGSPWSTDYNSSAMAADPAGPYLFVTIAGTGNLAMYNVDPGSGAVSGGAEYSLGGTPAGVAVDPQGRFVYVGINGGTVAAYKINTGTGTLTSAGGAACGGQPYHMVVDTSGKYLYIGDTSSALIYAYSINQSTGVLSSIGTFAVATPTASLATEPSGQYLYAGSWSSGTITGYRINPATGALSNLGTFTQPGVPTAMTTTCPAQ